MFIAGLVIGPVVGLLLGDYIFRSQALDPRLAIGGLIILGILFLFFPAIAIELRTGLLAGVPLGILLSATPMNGEPVVDEAAK